MTVHIKDKWPNNKMITIFVFYDPSNNYIQKLKLNK